MFTSSVTEQIYTRNQVGPLRICETDKIDRKRGQEDVGSKKAAKTISEL